jgi:hypothetical protein
MSSNIESNNLGSFNFNNVLVILQTYINCSGYVTLNGTTYDSHIEPFLWNTMQHAFMCVTIDMNHIEALIHVPNHSYHKAVIHFRISFTWTNWLQQLQHSITSIQQKPEQYKMTLLPFDLMHILQMIIILWVFTPRSKGLLQCFIGTYCLHLQGD